MHTQLQPALRVESPAMHRTSSHFITRLLTALAFLAVLAPCLRTFAAANFTEMDAAMDLARRTLAFVEKTEPRPEFARELAALQLQCEAAHKLPLSPSVAPGQPAQPNPAALAAQAQVEIAKLATDLRALRRRIVFSHPLLKFDKLLINKNPPTTYSHNCDQCLARHSRVGDGLTILENWKTHPRETVLLKGKLPQGAFAKPDLSWDAKHILFAFSDHTAADPTKQRFFIYEAAIDGSTVRQLTGTPRDSFATWMNRATVLIEDNDPCYLPDGGIAFISTRSQNFGRCHGGRYTPAFLLYRADGDGSNIRQLSWGEANEVEPSVLHDGRIIYTRWEYVDRHEMEFHKLWTTRPDGTAPSNFYGNDTIYPLMISEVLPIPGSHKVVATGMAHHSFNHGTIMVIDPDKGDNGPGPVTRITPEIRYPESDERGSFKRGTYASPYPLSEDLFLAAYSPENATFQGRVPQGNSFSIYLVDSLGGREFIFSDSNSSCFSPIPVVPRATPPALPSTLPPAPVAATGTYLIQDVYLTRNDPAGLIKRGDIKFLRFNELINKPAARSARLSAPVPNALPKRILGTVPVNPDGSVAVTVPARIPLQIQALDQNGMAILTERSFHYLQPGEVRSCVGCHEPSGSVPPNPRVASNWQPKALTPPRGPVYPGGFSFPRTVQPVLDRYCIGCHGLDGKIEGKVSLLGTAQAGYTQAYLALIPFTKTIGAKGTTHGEEKNISRPKDYYAHGGKLGPLLLANHARCNLDKTSFARIIDWLDMNAQCYGDYSFNRIENRGVNPIGEKALRDYLRTRFGPAIASAPYAALVNVGQPDESRILKAPLAVVAGGWGQIAQGAWLRTDDPDFQKAKQLVAASITPLPAHDIAGTCGRVPCVCGSCWVRELMKK